MYDESQIIDLFNDIKNKSFSDCSESRLLFKKIKSTAYSCLFNKYIYINLEKINQYDLPKKAVIGILAHELSHKAFYKSRSLFSMWLFLWNYHISTSKKIKLEHAVDEIAIKRGFGKELLAERKTQENRYSDDPKRLALVKKVYYSAEDLERMIMRIKPISRR